MLARENHNTEFKETWHDDYLKELCAFANSSGGVLYVGVDDEGQVVGLTADKVRDLLENIPNKVESHLGIHAKTTEYTEGDKVYIGVSVDSALVPISYHGRFFDRVGSTTRELKGPAILSFITKKTGVHWRTVLVSLFL